MVNLVLTLRAQGRLDDASTMQKEELQKAKQVLWDSHPSDPMTIHDLALILLC